jgi:RNAse (barnase) inhibitor barstar
MCIGTQMCVDTSKKEHTNKYSISWPLLADRDHAKSMAKVYEIDGRDFATLEEFYDVIGRVLIPGATWGHNLDALNDILRGGFGTPDDGFVLRWVHSALSRERLGIPKPKGSWRSV